MDGERNPRPGGRLRKLVFSFVICSRSGLSRGSSEHEPSNAPVRKGSCAITADRSRGAHARRAVSSHFPVPMTVAHLAHLNPEQRRAVEFGGPDFTAASPLLIIAGAGSGKTNTLAHRVAHLVVNGVDSRRIMLLTFSRRAAAEMTRRVERILAHVLRGNAGRTHALTWSGTFHAVGARLLREYAPQIGLDRSFTIHEREDSAG